MARWLIIDNGIVVSVIEKEDNITNEDYNGEFDTVQEDNDIIFNLGDDFDSSKMLSNQPEPSKRFKVISSIAECGYKIGIDENNFVFIGCNPEYAPDTHNATREQWINFTDEEIIEMAGKDAREDVIDIWRRWKPLLLTILDSYNIK